MTGRNPFKRKSQSKEFDMSTKRLLFSSRRIGQITCHLILLVVTTAIMMSACNTQSTPTILPSVTSTRRPLCPNPHGGACLGTLAPGSYTTVSFIPTLTYTVPDGWTNLEDLEGNFLLQRKTDLRDQDITTGPFVGVYQNVAAPDGCNESRDPKIGQSVDDLTAWFQANEQLSVTDPKPVTIGTLTGVYIDVAKAPDAAGCSWELEAKYGKFAPLMIGGGISEFHHVSISPEWKERLFLLSFGEDGNVVIEVGPEGGSLPDYLTVVEPVLETFVFDQ